MKFKISFFLILIILYQFHHINSDQENEHVIHKSEYQYPNLPPEDITYVMCKLAKNKGDFKIAVHNEWSPNGAQRFLQLIRDGYYDNTAFYRNVKNFINHFGLSKDKNLREKYRGNRIKDDPHMGIPVTIGDMVFAGAGPDSRSTQIYISYCNSKHLGKASTETVFAHVVEGMENVKKLYNTPDMPPWGNGAKQTMIWSEGYDYLEREFPDFDYMDTCYIIDDNKNNQINENKEINENIEKVENVPREINENIEKIEREKKDAIFNQFKVIKNFEHLNLIEVETIIRNKHAILKERYENKDSLSLQELHKKNIINSELEELEKLRQILIKESNEKFQLEKEKEFKKKEEELNELEQLLKEKEDLLNLRENNLRKKDDNLISKLKELKLREDLLKLNQNNMKENTHHLNLNDIENELKKDIKIMETYFLSNEEVFWLIIAFVFCIIIIIIYLRNPQSPNKKKY